MPQKKQLKLGKNGFKYKPQHGVIVVCDGPKHQQTVYSALKSSGYKCKVVTV
jgi:hypothetical protein